MTRSDFLSGIDLDLFVSSASPASSQEGQAVCQAEKISQAVVSSDIGGLIRLLVSTAPADLSDEQTKDISFKLLLNFNRKAADLLEAKEMLDHNTLLENITLQSDCLAWLLGTPSRVKKCESLVGSGGNSFSEVAYKKRSLRTYLVNLSKEHPRTVIEALSDADLPSLCSDEQSLLIEWGTNWPFSSRSREYLHHLGMDVISRTIGHKHKSQIDYTRVGLLAEKMISPSVMAAVYGDKRLTDELSCVQLEPLFYRALSVNGNTEYGDGKDQLAQLATIFSSSELLAEKQKQYWTFSKFAGYPTFFRNGKFNYMARGFPEAVVDTCPESFLGALFLSGSPTSTKLLLDEGRNGLVAWEAMGRGNNLAAYLSAASNADLRAVFPLIIKKLGYSFKDGSDNNIAHLLASSPQSPQRQLLNKLITDVRAFDLFQQKNVKGQTPGEALKVSSLWRKETYFGTQLERKIQASRPKKVKQALNAMTKDKVSGKTKAPKPQM